MVQNNNLNYQEGMFLGKEELTRHDEFNELLYSLFHHAFGYLDNNTWIHAGLLDPRITKLKIQSKSLNGVNGIQVGIDITAGGALNSNWVLGRAIIGCKTIMTGDWIGAVNISETSEWTGKEGWISVADKADGDWYVRIGIAKTNYENALITINADGTGQFVKGKRWVEPYAVIRKAQYGHQTKIRTEQHDVLTIADYNAETGIITFSGEPGSFVPRTETRFAFVSTLSPFSAFNSYDLYSYPSLYIILTSTDEASADGFVLGKITIADGAVTNIEIFNASYQNNKYKFLGHKDDFVLVDGAVTTPKLANNAVETAKIKDGAVTSDKLADGAVTSAKVSNNAITENKIQDGSVTQNKIGNGVVSTGKIANEAVNTTKLADNAVTSQKIELSLQPVLQSQTIIDVVENSTIYPGTIITEGSNAFYSHCWLAKDIEVNTGVKLTLNATIVSGTVLPPIFVTTILLEPNAKLYSSNGLVAQTSGDNKMIRATFRKESNGQYRIEFEEIMLNFGY